MKNPAVKSCLLAITVALGSGCGTTSTDRGISGAGIGAGAGAIIGAVTGLSVLEAAALGAVGGGLTGAMTKPEHIDMGEPVWKRGTQAQAPAPAAPTYGAVAPTDPNWGSSTEAQHLNQVIFDVQSRLAARGYDPGPIDGKVGPQTRSAIRAYQQDRGMVVDGQVTPSLVSSLNT